MYLPFIYLFTYLLKKAGKAKEVLPICDPYQLQLVSSVLHAEAYFRVIIALMLPVKIMVAFTPVCTVSMIVFN